MGTRAGGGAVRVCTRGARGIPGGRGWVPGLKGRYQG